MGEMRAPGAAQGTTQLVLIVNASLHLLNREFGLLNLMNTPEH